MTAILKVDEIQDTSGNLIIKEDSNTITLGASGDTITIPSGATFDGSNATLSGFATTNGITVAGQWRVSNSPGSINNNDTIGTTDHGTWEQADTQYSNIGSAMTESSGVFTFPSTGIYLVEFKLAMFDSTEQSYIGGAIQYTSDNSSYNDIAEAFTSLKLINSTTTYCSTFTSTIIDVTDTSNIKVRFKTRCQNNGINVSGSSSVNKTYANFIRLGDT
jgi:hypothetical protein